MTLPVAFDFLIPDKSSGRCHERFISDEQLHNLSVGEFKIIEKTFKDAILHNLVTGKILWIEVIEVPEKMGKIIKWEEGIIR